MTTVVAVHGAFHELWGPQQVAARWVPALRDGLGFVDAADIDPDEVSIAFYGDVFRQRPGAELTDPMLAEIAARTGITEAATAFVGDAGLEGLSKALGREQVNRTIAQLGRYFDDRAVRDAVRGARRRGRSPRGRGSSSPTPSAPSWPTRCWLRWTVRRAWTW